MQKIIKSLLVKIGENTKREGLIDTPKRVSQMYKDVFYGYNKKKKPKITLFENEKLNITN